MALKFCTKCGGQNSEMALFCGSCGSKIENGRLSDQTEGSDISTPKAEIEERIIPSSLPEDLKNLSVSSRVEFPTAVSMGLRRYVDFRGRSSRAEFWWFYLFISLSGYVLSAVEGSLIGSTVLSLVFSLGTFVPMIASAVRRLHDIGRSGWWTLLALTLFGIIVLIYWWCKEKDPVTGNGENKHGLRSRSEDYEIEAPKFATPAFISGAIVLIIIFGIFLGGFGSSFSVSEPKYSGCSGLSKLASKVKGGWQVESQLIQVSNFGDRNMCDQMIRQFNQPHYLKD